ncbi:DUF1634 domain-containing protein [Dysgonomonas sp. Marseille-P4677]|uniref:DUF1634 domain-containing protein n=1 Tax=Dysgonomonas sp. Marseille-P4677 TaxID=2364790 RepID=UPI001912A9D5|nr:DUF1634 domain-containing protein [Dysgonomonas sp. Marseille-P4677]MBK5720030.1 DUF1634 domain-containing protein [Dysgonomonas sp. Marseille-P4677]
MSIFSKEFWAERDVELFIGKLLRYGVMISCAITLFGGVIYLYQMHGQSMAHYKPIPDDLPFPGVEYYLRELSTIIPRVLSFDGAAIIQLGVCVLIATPIFRVAFSVIGFLIEKDYMYVVITLIVLCIIIANMLLGLH